MRVGERTALSLRKRAVLRPQPRQSGVEPCTGHGRNMYNPKHFQLNDLGLARGLIDAHPLGLLIGPDAAGASFVSHLPMGWGEDAEGPGQGWWLEGHLARANPHWGWLTAQREVLAVFTGPQGYVSPSHYDSVQNVPTWNYLAVHVRGLLEIVDAPEQKDALLKRLIARHEPAYIEQWRSLPADYQQKMLSAIVGFRLRVSSWQAKAKLSQNRPAVERGRVHAHFAAGTPAEQDMAQWMSRLGLV